MVGAATAATAPLPPLLSTVRLTISVAGAAGGTTVAVGGGSRRCDTTGSDAGAVTTEEEEGDSPSRGDVTTLLPSWAAASSLSPLPVAVAVELVPAPPPPPPAPPAPVLEAVMADTLEPRAARFTTPSTGTASPAEAPPAVLPVACGGGTTECASVLKALKGERVPRSLTSTSTSLVMALLPLPDRVRK